MWYDNRVYFFLILSSTTLLAYSVKKITPFELLKEISCKILINLNLILLLNEKFLISLSQMAYFDSL